MLIVRLRAEGDGTKALRQEVYDLFQEDVEVRVRQQVSLRIAATVTELEKDFYGTALALDEVRPRVHACFQAVRAAAKGTGGIGTGGRRCAAVQVPRRGACGAIGCCCCLRGVRMDCSKP